MLKKKFTKIYILPQGSLDLKIFQNSFGAIFTEMFGKQDKSNFFWTIFRIINIVFIFINSTF